MYSMPMPRKRELAAYILLAERGVLEYGEAIELLRRELCVTKRTARGIVKRLKRIGAVALVERNRSFHVVAKPPDVFLREIIDGYIRSRKQRCLGMTRAVLDEAAADE